MADLSEYEDAIDEPPATATAAVVVAKNEAPLIELHTDEEKEAVPAVEKEEELKGGGGGDSGMMTNMPSTPPPESVAPLGMATSTPRSSEEIVAVDDDNDDDESKDARQVPPPVVVVLPSAAAVEQPPKETSLWKRIKSVNKNSGGGGGKNGTEGAIASSAATPPTSLTPRLPTSSSSSANGGDQRHNSPSGSNNNSTTPVPFQLSSSNYKSKNYSTAPQQQEALRRVPGLISLHYELRKSTGVVSKTVGWVEGPVYKPEKGPAVSISAPPSLSSASSTSSLSSPAAVLDFVREHGGFPSVVPSNYDVKSQWSVMCAAAGVCDALTAAVRELSSWEISQGASAAAEAHRLMDYLKRVGVLLNAVTHTHDPLRQALSKQKLPWDDRLAVQVRWAAQHAVTAVITHSLTASEDAERVKGAWQRQAVLKPLGHGVMAAFAVHQLSGGFSAEAASKCDALVERTIHYARLIDPKWFRGHKVVL